MNVEQAIKLIRFTSDVILCAHPKDRYIGPYAGTSRFTCAALKAANRELFDAYTHPMEIVHCLEAFGLSSPSLNMYAFAEFADDEIQGARFLWLDFLAHVLEDQPDLFDYCQAYVSEV